MKRAISLLLLLLCCTLAYSQSQKIEIEKGFLETRFTQNGKKLNYRKMARIMKETHPPSYQLMRKARTQQTLAIVSSVTAGFFFGLSIGASSDETSTQRLYTLIVPSTALSSLILVFSAEHTALKAVELYNRSLDMEPAS